MVLMTEPRKGVSLFSFDFAPFVVIKVEGEVIALLQIPEEHGFEAFQVYPYTTVQWEEVSQAEFETYQTFGIPAAEFLGEVKKVISKPDGTPMYVFVEGVYRIGSCEIPRDVQEALTSSNESSYNTFIKKFVDD